MPHPNRIKSPWWHREPMLRAADDRGSAMIELIFWVAGLAIPILLGSVGAIRVEQTYAATQNIAREIVREASLGLDYRSGLSALAADYSRDPSEFVVTVSCLAPASPCEIYATTVSSKTFPFLPSAVAVMRNAS